MSESYTIKGIVDSIEETKVISDKFSVREFCLTVEDGNYPQILQFQCANRNTSLLDNIGQGEEVEVTFNLRGRRVANGRVYNSLDCWKLEAASPFGS